MKIAEDLDRAIWKVYQSIPMYSSNPEDLIKPIRDFVNQQVAAERERIKVSLKTLLRAAWWLGADNHDNPQSGFENWYEREQPIKKLIDSL